MPWLQLSLVIDQHSPETLEALLLEMGALSVSIEDAGDQPLLEPLPGETPLWDCARLSALFSVDADCRCIEERLQRQGFSGYTWSRLADQAWERAWLDDFEPMQFGDHLWVCPSGFPHPDGTTVVELDPGLAFGTGRHPTTALCLEWLAQTELDGCSIIDFGCGSGILAVAAALLGATRVTAVDIDAQARLATGENARRNGVAAAITTCGPDDLAAHQVDHLIANILAQPLAELAPRFAQLVRPGGTVVLSGLLDDQAEWVAGAYEQCFELQAPVFRTGWARLTGLRKRVHSVPCM